MNRKSLLKLLGIFLAMMIVFTILSRSLSSVTVARVQVASPGNAAIYHEVTATGKVMENQEQPIFTEANQRVARMYVHEGDSVEANDVLLQVDTEVLKKQIDAAGQELEKLKLEHGDVVSVKEAEQEKKSLALQRAQEDYDAAVQKGEQDVSWAAYELEIANRKLNEYYANRKEVEEVDDTQSQNSEDALVEAVNSAQKAYEEAQTAREEAIRTARRAIEDAHAKEGADSTAKQKTLEINNKKLQLQRLQKLAKANGEVTSPVKGVVTKLNVSTGEMTGENAALLLADLTTGCKFVAQVDKSKEKYLEKDAAVTLENSTAKKKVEDVKVDSVEVNEEDKNLLDVTVYLPADTLSIGSSADMTIQQKSGTYSCCVPIQALHEGSGETYVYVVEERESILGTQLTAVKMSVTVQDKNEMYAALGDGNLTSSQKVIINSSRSVDNGSPVRLEE